MAGRIRPSPTTSSEDTPEMSLDLERMHHNDHFLSMINSNWDYFKTRSGGPTGYTPLPWAYSLGLEIQNPYLEPWARHLAPSRFIRSDTITAVLAISYGVRRENPDSPAHEIRVKILYDQACQPSHLNLLWVAHLLLWAEQNSAGLIVSTHAKSLSNMDLLKLLFENQQPGSHMALRPNDPKIFPRTLIRYADDPVPGPVFVLDRNF